MLRGGPGERDYLELGSGRRRIVPVEQISRSAILGWRATDAEPAGRDDWLRTSSVKRAVDDLAELGCTADLGAVAFSFDTP
jgi:hypothetical protein